MTAQKLILCSPSKYAVYSLTVVTIGSTSEHLFSDAGEHFSFFSGVDVPIHYFCGLSTYEPP
jgi:hypothetical protein